jgi:hypothetical protein
MRATKSPQQYPYMQYPYQNVGTQLTWRGSAPLQTRAPQLGSLGDPTLELPVPGGPEPIPVNSGYSGYEAVGDCGCGCNGKGTCRPKAMGVFDPKSPAVIALAAFGAYLLYKKMKKRR